MKKFIWGSPGRPDEAALAIFASNIFNGTQQ
jgi:hypothetical protein